ncbi:flavin reductase family protein [Paraburkholderia sp. 32]|uniref:flavin reductase family protein n=1 Tax=Paraburkholderia sp. 32 TaxID=2991057 RepID=UPI003D195A1F
MSSEERWGRFASGVTVLSVSHSGGVRSMTANAFTSVYLDPPLVVVSIAHTASFLALLNSADADFGISFLSSKQRIYRDMHAGSQHVTSSPVMLSECGKELAGLAPGKQWSFLGLVDAVAE